jgi:hypothetical protein
MLTHTCSALNAVAMPQGGASDKMHVSLVFDLVAAFAKIGPRFSPFSPARRTAGGSFHRTAADVPNDAARFGDRPGRGASLLSNREDAPT